jgi:hypothetical protein
VDISLEIRPEPIRSICDGYIIVDDHVNLLNIDTSGNDVGGDKNFGFRISEPIENGISFFMFFVPMKRRDRVTIFLQTSCYSVGSISTLYGQVSTPLSKVGED